MDYLIIHQLLSYGPFHKQINMYVCVCVERNELKHISSQWRDNERDGVQNHQRLDCLLNRLFRQRSKKHQSSASPAFVMEIHRWPLTSGKQCGNVSIWWRLHVIFIIIILKPLHCEQSVEQHKKHDTGYLNREISRYQSYALQTHPSK